MQRVIKYIEDVCARLNVSYDDVVFVYENSTTKQLTFFLNWRYVVEFDVAKLNDLLSDSAYNASNSKPRSVDMATSIAEGIPYQPSIAIQKSLYNNGNAKEAMLKAE